MLASFTPEIWQSINKRNPDDTREITLREMGWMYVHYMGLKLV